MVYTLEEWNERVVQSGVNKNGADLFLPSSDDNIIFCVYDKDGKMIGVPYSGMFCYFSLQTWMTIDSHSTYHLRCKWKETGKYDDVTYPFVDVVICQIYLLENTRYHSALNIEKG